MGVVRAAVARGDHLRKAGMGSQRDVRVTRSHLYFALVAAAVFFLLFLVVKSDHVDDWEEDITTWINDAPSWLAHGLWPIMQLGTIWAPIVIAIVAAYVYGWRRGVAVIVSGLAAWLLAKWVKNLVERGRPLAFIPDINVREGSGTGFGFVSGHTAVAFAVATALAPVLPRWGRALAYAIASVVGLARIVYGVHFPLDVLGGACMGIIIGCVVDLVLLAVPAPGTDAPSATSRV
jgi:glycosyltransferase 2 family protein